MNYLMQYRLFVFLLIRESRSLLCKISREQDKIREVIRWNRQRKNFQCQNLITKRALMNSLKPRYSVLYHRSC